MKKKPTLPKSAPLAEAPKEKPKPRTQPIAILAIPSDYADDDDFDEAKNSEARREAFSARFQFAGTALQPFSITRERLLMDIRAACGAGEFGRMDAMFADALRFVWLCIHDGEQLERFQAGVGLPGLNSWPLNRRFQMAIDRWADQNDATIKAHRDEMVETFIDSWKASQVNHAVTESSINDESEDDSGN